MPMFSKYLSKGAYHWAEVSSNPMRHNAFTAARYRLVIEFLGDVKGRHVLDIGCGDGVLSYRLAKLGAAVWGVDSSALGLCLAEQQVRKRGEMQCRFLQSLASHLPFRDASFDTVVAAEVIEHLRPEDVDLFMLEGRRVLRPGGTLLVTTPYRLTGTPLDVEHCHEYYPSELARLLQSCGFGDIETMNSHPVFWLEVFRLRLFGRPVLYHLVNLLSILGYNLFAAKNAKWQYYSTFTIMAKTEV